MKDYLESRFKDPKLDVEDQEEVRYALEDMPGALQVELNNSGIRTKYSGTTLVVALIIKSYLYLLNIGDSRAILASNIKGNLQMSLETEDHNPENPEERLRIEAFEGKVCPYKDQSGEFVGPHRVWSKGLREPGLAMSRSLGDNRAHELGVSFAPGK